MLKTPDWAAGAEYLREHASELIPLIDRFPVCELKPEPQEKYFGTLVTGIVSQQLPPDVSLQLLKNLGKFWEIRCSRRQYWMPRWRIYVNRDL